MEEGGHGISHNLEVVRVLRSQTQLLQDRLEDGVLRKQVHHGSQVQEPHGGGEDPWRGLIAPEDPPLHLGQQEPLCVC